MSPTTPKYLTGDVSGINAFIDQFDVFLFDCDGVLWSGDHVFEGVVETLEMLRGRGKRIVFVTNNSTKSREDYQKKLNGMGIPAETDEIFGSAYSSAIYISRILALPPPRNKIFVLGESGIEAELRSESLPFIGGTDPSLRRDVTPADFVSIADGTALDPDVGIVLTGLDFHVNYLKLSLAYHYLGRGATLVATNADSTLPSHGALFPGAGAIGAPLIHTTGLTPLVMGKPSQAMLDAIQGKFQLDRRRTCMVGDRLDTDIRFGIQGGLGGTLAVLTGVSRRQDWEDPAVPPPPVPTDAHPEAQTQAEQAKERMIFKPGWWVDRLSDLNLVRERGRK